MDELDTLRKKKIELYKQNYASAVETQLEEEQQLQQQLHQLESAVKQMMSQEALQRYSTVKLAHPEKAVQALVVLAQMAQSGNTGIISDAQLKNILMHITPQKKPTNFKLHGAL